MKYISKLINVTKCCDSEYYTTEKGSYLGEYYTRCNRCNKLTILKEKTIQVIDKTPAPFSLYNPNEFNE